MDKISFTELLYSVVIGMSFLKIDLNMSLISILMFSFAMLVIVDDWIEYHYYVRAIFHEKKLNGTRKKIILMVIDFLFLVIWYLIVIMPFSNFQYYLLLFSILFFLGVIWTLISLGIKENVKFLISETDIPLVIYFLIVFLIYSLFDLSSFRVLIIVISIICFVILRFPVWLDISSQEFDI